MNFLTISICVIAPCAIWFMVGYTHSMSEAHDRGYAVECEGKLGYYWECESKEPLTNE